VSMRRVAIVGIGYTKIGEHWGRSLRDLFVEAALKAMDDAGVERVDALYVGNMMSASLQEQEHLGALLAGDIGLSGIPACKVEAACASGGMSIHQAYLAVASGEYDIVMAAGVEKMTDRLTPEVTLSLAMAEDREYVIFSGATFVGLNALLHRLYMHKYGAEPEDIALVAVNDHENAVNTPYAHFRNRVSVETVLSSPMIADPIHLFECAEKAKIEPKDIDFVESHDAFTILGVMTLEDLGFARKGEGYLLVREGQIARDGRIPMNTMGGLKARGHPIGATGIYQAVDAVLQLRGEAGKNQLSKAERGLIHSMGGVGGTVVINILRRAD